MRRIAIVGTDRPSHIGTGFRITACRWDRLQRLGNVSDYDVVIMNLSNIDPQASVDWETYWEVFTHNAFIDLVGHDGQVIVIGDARFVSRSNVRGPHGHVLELPMLYWTGMKFEWDSVEATTTTVSYLGQFDGLRSYLDHLHQAPYALLKVNQMSKTPDSFVRHVAGQWGGYASVADVILVPIVTHLSDTRYQRATAMAVKPNAVILDSRKDRITDFELGELILLPTIPLRSDDQIDLVLSDYLGIGIVEHEPAWVAAIQVPGQQDVEESIRQLDEQVERLETSRNDYLQERAHIRSILRLLYDRDYGLEEAVRNALTKLGATVEEPTEPGKEDGWIHADLGGKQHIGVLEIKSTKNESFNQQGLRQLHDWKMQGVLEKGLRLEEIKGIFVGNSAYDQNWNERSDPFASNWEEAARNSGCCAMTSSSLYFAWHAYAEGCLDIAAFWRLVFETDGVLRQETVEEFAISEMSVRRSLPSD